MSLYGSATWASIINGSPNILEEQKRQRESLHAGFEVVRCEQTADRHARKLEKTQDSNSKQISLNRKNSFPSDKSIESQLERAHVLAAGQFVDEKLSFSEVHECENNGRCEITLQTLLDVEINAEENR